MNKHSKTTKVTDSELRTLLAYSRALGRAETFSVLRELAHEVEGARAVLAEAKKRLSRLSEVDGDLADAGAKGGR